MLILFCNVSGCPPFGLYYIKVHQLKVKYVKFDTFVLSKMIQHVKYSRS